MNKLLKLIALTIICFLVSCTQTTTYKVTFKNDDGTIYKEITASHGKYIQEPTEPIKEGYIFVGWYLNNEKFDFSNYEIKQNITLYAKYEDESVISNTYTITYELNGGYAQNPSTYTVFDEFTLNNPTKKGYTFIGWTTPTNDQPKLNLTLNKETGDKHFTANYELITYTITYDLKNSALMEDLPSKYTVEDVVTLPNLFSSVSTFLGWSTPDNEIPYLDVTLENETGDKHFIANYSGLSFILNENGEYSIKSSGYGLNKIYIPKYYNGKNITTVEKDAFIFTENLIEVLTDDDNLYFTSINGNLYTKDEKTLIKYTTGKEDSAFIIPNSVTTIASYAFKGCDSLTNITFSNNLTTIEDYAFYNCINLTNIVFPDNLTNIGRCAFYNCENLNEIILPNSITTIKDEAFYNTNQTNIIIPSKVTNLGSSVFGNCNDIIIYCETNTIPSTWSHNWNKEDYPVHFGVTNNNLLKENNFEYILDLENKTATLSRYTGTDEFIEISPTIKNNNIDYTITKIGRWAFKRNENLINISLPDDIELIDSSAFNNCTNLANIKLPKNLKTLGFGVFNKCMSLTSITLPENLTTIGGSAFENCQNLTYINLPNSLTHIREYAFYNCINLIRIIIPNSVTIIERKVFNYCDSLIIYCEAPSKPTGWDSDWNYTNQPVYYGIDESYFVEIDNLQYILDSENNTAAVSRYLSTIQSIQIPETITYNNIEYIVTKIEDKAFFNYNNLISVEIPNVITNIGRLAFYNCINLTNVYYNGTIEDWCNIIFNKNLSNPMSYAQHFYMKNESSKWEEVTEIVIPNTITNINNCQFYGFDNLISIELPNTITNIGNNAFSECSHLTNIEIPNSVITIGEYAFSYCDSFTNITIPSSVTTIERYAFYSCSALEKIIIPSSVIMMGDNVFVFCNELKIYCEVVSRLYGWSYNWNSSNLPVVWKYIIEE